MKKNYFIFLLLVLFGCHKKIDFFYVLSDVDICLVDAQQKIVKEPNKNINKHNRNTILVRLYPSYFRTRSQNNNYEDLMKIEPNYNIVDKLEYFNFFVLDKLGNKQNINNFISNTLISNKKEKIKYNFQTKNFFFLLRTKDANINNFLEDEDLNTLVTSFKNQIDYEKMLNNQFSKFFYLYKNNNDFVESYNQGQIKSTELSLSFEINFDEISKKINLLPKNIISVEIKLSNNVILLDEFMFELI